MREDGGVVEDVVARERGWRLPVERFEGTLHAPVEFLRPPRHQPLLVDELLAKFLHGGVVVTRQACERIRPERLVIDVEKVIRVFLVPPAEPPHVRVDRSFYDERPPLFEQRFQLWRQQFDGSIDDELVRFQSPCVGGGWCTQDDRGEQEKTTHEDHFMGSTTPQTAAPTSWLVRRPRNDSRSTTRPGRAMTARPRQTENATTANTP